MFQSAVRQKIFFTIIMISVYVIAWIIQAHFLLNWDVSWDIRISKRMLMGGTYAKDFIDTNPPLSLLSYSPALLLAKLFSIKMYTALRLYVFLLSTLSLYFCSTFTKKIFFHSGPIA